MQIFANSAAYGGSQAQRVLNMLLQHRDQTTGQDLPGTTEPTTATPPPSPPPSSAADQFATNTLAGLISAQAGPPTSADLASAIMQKSDSDGDGELSADEIANALGADSTFAMDAIQQALGKLDTDGDGKLSASELTSGLDAAKQAHRGHHAHHGHGVQEAAATAEDDPSADLAAQIFGAADANGDGQLSGDELTAALGAAPNEGFAQTLSKLDTDGNGSLSTSELTAAIDAFRSAHQHSQGSTDSQTTPAASVTA